LGAAASRVRIGDLRSLGAPAVVEDADIYAANASKKAHAAAIADPAAAVLADDSGIEVAALGGAPGIQSARWATAADGTPLDGAGLNAALRLDGVPEPQRGARLVCAVALLLPDGRLGTGWGEVAGHIAHDQRGARGFGYDAVFVLPDGRRLSEVGAAVKDLVGHRGQAVRGVVPELRRWLREPAATGPAG